ncbi:MAG: hypothetical protein JXA25_00755, partial [Anaerolineales bacterium]|nr:hypothetical protein [Anaerolineales bacterium]
MRITELFRLSDVKAAWLDFAGLLRSFTGRSPQRRTPCDTRPPSQQPSLLIVLQTLALAVLLPIASEAAVPHTPVHAEGLSAPLFSPACSFYIAPAGDDTHTGASTTDPWRTFTHALAQLQPGDTLCLLDGIYTQPLDIRVSGTETQPLTIRALHDGQAVIDGEYLHAACQVKDSQNVILEGVICRRSAGDVVLVVNAQRIIIRRVSAYDVRATDCNCQAFGTNNAEDVLFEDAIAGGRARTSFTLYNSRRITVRRAYARWQEEPTSDSMGVNNLMQIYGTNESLAENNVGTLAGQTQNEVLGWGVWNHIYNTDPIASENTFIGNIAFDLTHAGFFDTTCRWQTRHNTFLNNASINNRFGMWQRGDDSQILTNFIHTGGEMGFFMRETSPDGECEPVDGFSLGSTLTGSVFLSVQGPVFNILQTNIPKTLTHETNLYWDNESIEMELSGSESDTVDPVFNTERWGYGAYLFPDPVSPRYSGGQDYAYLGADIRYRSEDGVETGEPLWPWPMEERICDELGVSVTWELSDQVSASTGERCAGGLWKTLDGVYEQQEQTFNDIPPGFWAYDEIEALYRAGYIAGCSAEPR